MEPIDLIGSSSGFHTIDDKEKRKAEKKKKSSKTFSSLFTSAEHSADIQSFTALGFQEDVTLEEVLDEIHEIGEELKKKPTLPLVKVYRQAVGAFVRYVVKNGLAVEKKQLSGFKILKLRQGMRPELTLVQVVDKKLDDLAAQILRNQKDQLDILRRIDEIHGILVDILT